MTIILDNDLAAAVEDQAQRTGVTPESLVVHVLQERFGKAPYKFEPRDAWEAALLKIPTDCGVSLSNEAVSSEGIYD